MIPSRVSCVAISSKMLSVLACTDRLWRRQLDHLGHPCTIADDCQCPINWWIIFENFKIFGRNFCKTLKFSVETFTTWNKEHVLLMVCIFPWYMHSSVLLSLSLHTSLSDPCWSHFSIWSLLISRGRRRGGCWDETAYRLITCVVRLFKIGKESRSLQVYILNS